MVVQHEKRPHSYKIRQKNMHYHRACVALSHINLQNLLNKLLWEEV